MSKPSKDPKSLIAEFEALLKEDTSTQKVLLPVVDDKNFDPSKVEKWLRPFLRSKLDNKYSDIFDAVNVHLELAEDQQTGTLKLLVFTGESLPALPRVFWIKSAQNPYLCTPQDRQYWHEAQLDVKHESDSKKIVFSIPYFFMSVKVNIEPLSKTKKEAEFLRAVMSPRADSRPHLKSLIGEGIYGLSKKDEMAQLAMGPSPEKLRQILRTQYEFKMQNWQKRLLLRTEKQKTVKETFTVSDRDFERKLLTQTEVNTLLRPGTVKKVA